jgi:carboxyl-terminal processing protease
MKKKKNSFVSGFILGMLAMAVVVVSIGAGVYFAQKGDGNQTLSGSTQIKMNALEKIIETYYLNDIDEEKLEEGIYKGLLSGLDDPYSVYYTAEEYEEYMQEASGTYFGIGVLVSQDEDTGVITAVRIFEDEPADKAGMKSGDVIYKVEGKKVTGEDLSSIVEKIEGEEGTKVNITVYRKSENKYIDLEITRDEVTVPTVTYKMLDKKNKIGYIQIAEFDQVTYKQFSKALKALKKQGMKSVIFDLRDNPGGFYNIVCEILDDLLPEGTIVYTKDKYGKEEKQTSDANCLNLPIVVLQNGNSASASEIFAGAIQDFKAGTIVGTQSFGKGIVQSILPLNDGSAIKLTVQNYYTPNGTNIHGKGITPDVKVEADSDSKDDVQLLKAQEVIKELMK